MPCSRPGEKRVAHDGILRSAPSECVMISSLSVDSNRAPDTNSTKKNTILIYKLENQ